MLNAIFLKINAFANSVLEHRWWWVIPVILVTIPAVAALFWPGYFNMHDDLQMMRQLELDKCFRDGQIPCRWVPDMGYGYGYPLFNYYPQGPYLVGEIFRVFGVNFVWTAKLLFAAGIIVSAVTMFVLMRRLFGGFAGLAAAGFYVLAPYHAVDVYVRGAMNESWALVWFPLILWSGMGLVREGKWKYLVWLVVGWAGLFMSHNLMVLIFTPVFAIWEGMWLVLTKNWRAIGKLVIAGVWAFGLVAFFELPVLFEQNLVQLSGLTSDYYNFSAHFVSLNQMLISRFWGYEGSIWGPNDGMSFQIGWLHWGLGVIAILMAVFLIIKAGGLRKVKSEVWVGLFMALVVGWGAAFMMHERSIFVWKLLPQIAILQFPWWFLTVVILGFSGAVGFLVYLVPKNWKWLVVVVLVGGAIGLYGNYFRPGKWGPLTDEEKFSGEAWVKQQAASITDYLPKTVGRVPTGAAGDLVEVVEGEAKIEMPKRGTNWASFVAESDGGAVVRLAIFDFPKWRVFLNGKETEVLRVGDDDLGRVGFRLPAGNWEVSARLFDTPVRQWGNAVSLVSLVVLASSWWWRKLKY